MRIEIYINPESDSVSGVLRELLKKVTKMSAQLDDLTAKVTALQSVEASAIALLQGLKVKLDEAIAGGDLAVIQALSDQIGISTQALSDAVIANTPVEA
jgi:hypothetical protein